MPLSAAVAEVIADRSRTVDNPDSKRGITSVQRTVSPGAGILVEEKEAFVVFTLSGRLDSRTDRELDERIVDECVRCGHHAVLIDIRAMSGRLSPLDNHRAALDFGRRMRPLERVAIVDLSEHRSANDHFENTAVNRGAPVRFFTAIEAAEKWLRGEAYE